MPGRSTRSLGITKSIVAVPQEIIDALGPLVPSMALLGYVPTEGRMGRSFGDFLVSFEGRGGRIEISRDRSQFIVAGGRDELQSFGLWRAFDTIAQLEPPLVNWLKAKGDA